MNSNGSIRGNVDKVESPSAMRFLPNHPPQPKPDVRQGQGHRHGQITTRLSVNPGFGGWADEKVEPARETASHVFPGRLG
ncbi:MAG: hypothetical protein IIC00_12800 [Planctomycetes bacterium]|nr:hypothetical protein [Planctomycetota bacterium]